MDYTVSYDSRNGMDYERTFNSIRAAYGYYTKLDNVPYKDITFDHRTLGTITLINSKGTDNMSKYFCLNDYA